MPFTLSNDVGRWYLSVHQTFRRVFFNRFKNCPPAEGSIELALGRDGRWSGHKGLEAAFTVTVISKITKATLFEGGMTTVFAMAFAKTITIALEMRRDSVGTIVRKVCETGINDEVGFSILMAHPYNLLS